MLNFPFTQNSRSSGGIYVLFGHLLSSRIGLPFSSKKLFSLVQEPEMNKQGLIKSISRKQSSSSPGKTNDWKGKEDQQEEETSMLEDVNPAVVENYWSTPSMIKSAMKMGSLP
ncbi:hypothetical protein [Acinetobacter sp.]|uniref:hypothetical protein n=1 Tax=Acinetobacter sp. TaxID=472 RepID=UPI003D0132CF